MKTIQLHHPIRFIGILALCLFTATLNAQLSNTFQDIFDEILGSPDGKGKLATVTFVDTATGDTLNHGNHFQKAAEAANRILTPALNNLITNNVSSFPLSSTSAGVSFDFSTGEPISIRESLGPIFAETGRTLGKGKFNIGMNYNHLNLSKVRGLPTEDIQFTFTHEDDSIPNGLGDRSSESDIIDLILDLHIKTDIFVFYTTFGLLKNLDVGIALPVININLNGNAQAALSSFTHIHEGEALHHFGPPNIPAITDPILKATHDYNESAFGIGDLAVRLKYSLFDQSFLDVAAMVDVRLPTGKKEDFLGTGEVNVRFVGILSKKINQFTPHINVGYDYRGAEYDSDELEYAIGFDQKIVKGLTFALDFLGEVDLNEKDVLVFEYQSYGITITDEVDFTDPDTGVITEGKGKLKRNIDQTNIPTRDNDNVHNIALGFRYAPTDSNVLLANILLPLNSGGLRSSIAYTLGFAATF